MRRRDAVKLRPRDEVKVRIWNFGGDVWENAYVLSEPLITHDGVFFSVQSDTEGFMYDIRHTDLR